MAVLIKECIASRQGLFENRTFSLDERLTFIRGRNNSGKSLLARALVDLLHARRTPALLLERAAWEHLYLDALLANSHGEYRFTRNGSRSFGIKSQDAGAGEDLVALDLREAGDAPLDREILESLERDARGASLKEFFLFFDGDALASLCFVPSPSESANGSAGGYGSLRRIFVEDSSNFYGLYSSISERIGDGTPGSRMKNPLVNEMLRREGELRDLDKRIEIIDLEYSKYEKLIRERREVEGAISSGRGESARLAGLKDVAERVLDNTRKCGDIETEIAARERDIAEEDRKTGEIEAIAARAHDLFPQFREFSDSQRNNLRKIQDLYRELRDANEELNNLASKIAYRRRVFKNIVLSMNIASLFAILLTYGNILLNIPPEKKTLLVMGILIVALAGVAGLMIYNLVTSRSKGVAELGAGIDEIEGKVEALLTENNVRISEYRMETLYEFLLQYFEEYSEYTEMQMDILRVKSSLRDREQVVRLAGERDDLRSRLAEIRAEIDRDLELLDGGIARGAAPAEALEYIFATEKRIEKQEAVIRQEEQTLAQIDEEIRATSFHDDEKKECLEKRRKTSRVLDDLRAHQESMEYILKIFRETIGIRWKNQTDRLVARSVELFHELTEKQYITRIDAEQMRALVDGGGPGDLHQNVIHLMHLAIKLALGDFLIDLNLSLPLIIDDPFLFMDEVRIARLREILDDISETRQVIVFTHGSISSQWGRVIEI